MNFVLLSPRSGEEVLSVEYNDFIRATGLSPEELEQRPLDRPDSSLGSFEGVNGVFIGGSPFTITDPVDDQWQPQVSQRLVDFLTSTSLPVFCTCYGASMIAHYLGGSVSTRYAEKSGRSTAIFTAEIKNDPLCSYIEHDPGHEFEVLTGHNDSVVQLPEQAVLLAHGGDHCPVQFYRYGEQIWATQFHPEMDAAALEARMKFYMKHGYFEESEFDSTVASFQETDTHDANDLLKAFVRYCSES